MKILLLFKRISKFNARFLRLLFPVFSLALFSLSCTAQPPNNRLQIAVSDIPSDGIVIQSINIDNAPGSESSLKEKKVLTGKIIQQDQTTIPFVFVPDPSTDVGDLQKGTLVIYAPGKNTVKGILELDKNPVIGIAVKDQMTVKSKTASFSFKPITGGFPFKVDISGSNSQLNDFSWNDRLYNVKDGAYLLKNDHACETNKMISNSFVTVIRSKMNYVSSNESKAPGDPYAVYDWYFFNSSSAVYIRAWQNSSLKYKWKEAHFIEWNFPGEQQFNTYEGDIADSKSQLIGKKDILQFKNWAALQQNNGVVVALLNKARIYDDIKGKGTYIHSEIPDAWSGWDGISRSFSTWLWVGKANDAGKVIETVFEMKGNMPRVDLFPGQLTIEGNNIANKKVSAKGNLETNGSKSMPVDMSSSAVPSDLTYYKAGSLALAFKQKDEGIMLASLYDDSKKIEFLSSDTSALFSIKMRKLKTNEQIDLRANMGWSQCKLTTVGKRIELEFIKKSAGIDIAVLVTATPDESESAWHWNINVDNKSVEWALDNIGFPLVSISNLGQDSYVLYPQGSGVLKPLPFYADWMYNGKYPNGWASMQFMAVYSKNAETGLYIARHDAQAAAKDIYVEGKHHNLKFGFYQPVENPNTPGNDFKLTGDAVWRVFKGDWFDASMIYKSWVKGNASWWPKIGDKGRENTPEWFKKLDTWVIVNGSADEVLPMAKKVSGFLNTNNGLGVHWYRWHQVPFDNDYPHYFPAKSGFKQGVDELRRQKMSIMPYINGRLWDTKDKGNIDWEFTSLAKSSAVKTFDFDKKELVLSTESYNSQEKGGSKVVFAPMCPYTKLWQETLSDISNKLYKEDNVDAIYFDQVAATPPALCMDASHGHPLGGGTWWVTAYNKLMQQIRLNNPGKVLTTECNSEPYIQSFDGFLTWHWQFDGAVPAFPAVYAGAVVMFGRAFKAGDSKDLALRMKVAQQLTFGEQIGWIDGDYLLNQIGDQSKVFYKKIVDTRSQIQDMFYSGEMMRPPALKFSDKVKRLSADWQWSGKWMVTTNAILTGAWKKKERVVLIFSNPSDVMVPGRFTFNPVEYGLPEGTSYTITSWGDGTAKGQLEKHSGVINIDLNFQPLSTLIWEIKW